MGEVIELAQHRARRRATGSPRPQRAVFAFDLSCPFSYLAAESVERLFGAAHWVPASASTLRRGRPTPDEVPAVRAAAERRAIELRLPLQWPESFPDEVPAAMRAASYAVDEGRGAAFALAAARLAFCGGFDLNDPELLMEAAAAAQVSLEGVLAAARDPRRDLAIEEAGRSLLAGGADRLPALRLGHSLYCGERGVREAAIAARWATAAR